MKSLSIVRLLLISLAAASIGSAQELPIPGLESFDESIDFRTNVCDRQKRLYENKLSIPNALRGLNVTVAAVTYTSGLWKNYFHLSETTGGIPEDYPGLFVVIMDEIARRAGFSWRNSFGSFPPITASSTNKTWTDLLLWQIDKFDVSMDYWLRTEERLAKGVGFPEAWYDGSLIIVQPVISGDAAATDLNYLSLLRPFTIPVWGLILACIVVSGLMYYLLDVLDKDADEGNLESGPIGSVYLASMAFVGHTQFQPTTAPTKIITLSSSFWAVLMIS